MAGGIAGLGGGSGIDTETIINSIIQQRNRRIERIEDRITKAEDQKRAFLDINSRLLSMQETARRLMNGTSFNASVVRSSDANVLLATGDSSTLQGTFQFYTKSLASVSQYVSTGLPDTGVTRVSSTPGTLTIEVGEASVVRATELDALNGHSGVSRGKIRITDDGGRTAVVDLSFAFTLNDVIDAINNNGIAQVSARVNDLSGSGLMGDALIIENVSRTGSISVADVGLGKTATSLGIVGESLGGAIVGGRINSIGRNTPLSALNDGRGIGTGAEALRVVTLVDSSGSRNIDITAARTVGEVMDLVNNSGGAATLSVAEDGRRLVLTDTVQPSPTLAITDSSAPGLVAGLGLEVSAAPGATATLDAAAGMVTGGAVIGALNSVRMASLAGVNGDGFMAASATNPHSFDIVDSNGAVATVFYTGVESLSDIVMKLNRPSGPAANVLAKVDASGMGIEIIDLAGGPGSLTITDAVGNLAATMGIAGTHDDGKADAGNLNFRHMHGNRLLSDFGLDEGFVSGRVEIVDRTGIVRQIDISGVRTLGGLVQRLNAAGSVNVSLNKTGDGIQFDDLSGGNGPLVIRDTQGNIARKLGLAGTFTQPGLVDRRHEYTVDVSPTDTLNDIVAKIQGLGIPVIATTVDDGAQGSGFRLSITGKAPGARNTISVRSDVAALNFGQTSAATDAVLLYGNAEGGGDPVVVRSTSNTFKRVLPGVTLDLLSVSHAPVTVSVTRDLQAASNDVRDLFDGFNGLAGRIDELAGYDSETQKGGPLLGNGTVQRLEFQIVQSLLDPVNGLPIGSNALSSFGIIRKNDGTFSVDQEKLLAALESRLEELRDVFGNQDTLNPDTLFKNWNGGEGVKTESGADFRIKFADGSADLEVDMDNMDRLDQLLKLINDDGRAQVEISPNGRTLRIRDLTTPNGTNAFTIESIGNSNAALSLGFLRTAPLPGSTVIETREVPLSTNQGVGRRLDTVLTAFAANDGLIQDQTGQIDSRISRFNEDIEKMEERISAERERLERRFAAMEAALAESQQAASTLASQASNLSNNNNRR